MHDDVKFLTSREVMEILQISRATLSRWVAKKTIPVAQFGGENRFPKSYFQDVIQKALEGRKEENQAVDCTPPNV